MKPLSVLLLLALLGPAPLRATEFPDQLLELTRKSGAIFFIDFQPRNREHYEMRVLYQTNDALGLATLRQGISSVFLRYDNVYANPAPRRELVFARLPLADSFGLLGSPTDILETFNQPPDSQAGFVILDHQKYSLAELQEMIRRVKDDP